MTLNFILSDCPMAVPSSVFVRFKSSFTNQHNQREMKLIMDWQRLEQLTRPFSSWTSHRHSCALNMLSAHRH